VGPLAARSTTTITPTTRSMKKPRRPERFVRQRWHQGSTRRPKQRPGRSRETPPLPMPLRRGAAPRERPTPRPNGTCGGPARGPATLAQEVLPRFGSYGGGSSYPFGFDVGCASRIGGSWGLPLLPGGARVVPGVRALIPHPVPELVPEIQFPLHHARPPSFNSLSTNLLNNAGYAVVFPPSRARAGKVYMQRGCGKLSAGVKNHVLGGALRPERGEQSGGRPRPRGRARRDARPATDLDGGDR
jgi:hypothetical protein